MPSSESKRIRAMLVNGRESVGMPVQQLRQEWEDAVAGVPPPPDVTVPSVDVDGISGEWVARADRETSGTVILFLHGGGHNAGSCRTHRDLGARLAEAASARVLLIDYRLAPEFPFPAALEDAVAAYRWLLRTGFAPDRIVLGGDSSGGGLALAALVKLRDDGEPLPAAAFLVSPWVDLTLSDSSIQSRATVDPLVSIEGLRAAARYYLDDHDPRDPLASPLYANLHGLPPLLIQVGDHELLLGDASRLYETAKSAGVDVELEIWNEMWHVWHGWAGDLPEGREAFACIGQWLSRHTRGAQDLALDTAM